VPGRAKPRPTHDLLSNAVFYKVGQHCSDNETAKKQGVKGWDMPAPPLFRALKEKTSDRVALSDVTETLTNNARQAGIRATDADIDYFLP
jgi:hypothetical protein